MSAIAKTINDGGPIFVMAPRRLSVEANSALQLVAFTGNSFVLWRILFPDRDKTDLQDVR